MKSLLFQPKVLGHSSFLRCALKANGVFSLASAVIISVGAVPISAALGALHPRDLLLVGVGLVVYFGFLWTTARRECIFAPNIYPFIILDIAWVAASGVVVATKSVTSTGRWAVSAVAGIVLVLAAAQWFGIRRLRFGQNGPRNQGSKTFNAPL